MVCVKIVNKSILDCFSGLDQEFELIENTAFFIDKGKAYTRLNGFAPFHRVCWVLSEQGLLMLLQEDYEIYKLKIV